MKRATISAEEKKKQTNKKTELLTNKCFLLGKKVMTNLDSELKGRDITLLTKVHLVKAMDFPSSHVLMCELDQKEG